MQTWFIERDPSVVRILHLAAHYYPDVAGGAEAHLQQISERLARRGHDVTVFTTDRSVTSGLSAVGRGEATHEVINRVTVKRFLPTGWVVRSLRRFLRLRGSYRLLRVFLSSQHIGVLSRGPLNLGIISATLRHRADVVTLSNWSHTSLVYQGSLVRRLSRVPFVGIPLLHTEEGWSRSPLVSGMLARCDVILANTDYEKHFIETLAPRHGPVHVVGVGVDPLAFSQRDGAGLRLRLGMRDVQVVGYVGRMQPGKGVLKLIEAMRIVWRANSRVYLLLAGRRFPPSTRQDRDFQQAVVSLSPDERARVVHIDGFDDNEKASLFDAMDVFAMPSIAESFGITYLEAWMCRKPVIGARIGSTQCVLDDGVDGVLVDPHDPRAIAAAILELLANRSRALQMGQAGFEKTIARFTWDKITDRLEEIFQNLTVSLNRERT